MISNPNCGRCDFKLRTFEGRPSDITDVPVDFLNAFINYHNKGYGIICFDEEGTEFTLVITLYSLFIIEERDKIILHDFSELKIENLEKELISDIENDLNGWMNFTTDEDWEEVIQHRDEIFRRIDVLKKCIKH